MNIKKWLAAVLALAFTGGVIAAEIDDLQQVDAQNSNSSHGFPENMAPSAVNNNLRALEGIIARWRVDLEGGLTSIGTANAIIVSSARSITSYYDGLMLSFRATLANTASPTLNVDGNGTRYIAKNGDQTLVANDIRAGQRVVVSYDSSNSRFQMLSSEGGASLFTDPMTTRGDIIYRDASAAARLAVGTTANSVLRSDGTDPQWRSMDSIMDSITSTRGAIIYRGASVWGGLSPGTNGQVITSNGTDPYWGTASNNFSFVSATTATNVATVDIQSLAAGYDYLFAWDGLIPATDNVGFYARVEEAAAFQADATDYGWGTMSQTIFESDDSDSEIQVNTVGFNTGWANNAIGGGNVALTLLNPGGTGTYKSLIWYGGHWDIQGTRIPTPIHGLGTYISNQNAVTGLRFLFSSGNISVGRLVVYRRQRS